jgi:hypothetical protein
VFQLILPFQLDLPFDPAPSGASVAEGALGAAAEALVGRPARVRRPKVRGRLGNGSGLLELEAKEAL